MKKILFFLMTALFAVSCSNDDEPTDNTINQQIKEIADVLNGKFVSNDDTNLREITFTPYSSPKEEEFTIPGEYADIDKKVIVYGECTEVEHFGDFPVSMDWRYIINISYEDAQPELWFYPAGVYGRYETHDITIINSTSFALDNITFNKQ